MATLDGKDVPQCVHCTEFKPDARERTVTKDAGSLKRILCDDCADKVAQFYGVSPIGRKSARAKDDEGSAAAEASSTKKSKED